MDVHLMDLDGLGEAKCDGERVDEAPADPTMIAQGLRLHRVFMSISDAAAREAVISFALDRARGARAR
jgi:hypothetical protein